jgi:hypothetical protein
MTGCRHSGSVFGRNPCVFADSIEIKALDPGLKPAGVRAPIHVDNMKRANAPTALSGPRFPRPPAWPEVSDSVDPASTCCHCAAIDSEMEKLFLDKGD